MVIGMRFGVPIAWALLLGGALTGVVDAAEGKQSPQRAVIDRVEAPFAGDLAGMRERGMIRALVSYNRTNFTIVKGREKGFEYELLRSYEKELNKGRKDEAHRTRIVFVPTPFGDLLDDLQAGRGDLAAAGLTITPERSHRVDFTRPYIPDVSEVVVHHRSVDDIRSLEDLAGRRVLVTRGSSYAEHLEELNERLQEQGRRRVRVAEADPRLTTEDVLEMVDAGIIELTIADHHIARIWSEVLENVVVRKELELHQGGQIAWAVRKNNPELQASLNEFIKRHKKGSLLGNILFERYFERAGHLENPLREKDRRRLEELSGLFKKYAERYGFDWLAIAAQAYQESGLDHSKKSAAGAVGVMQVLPATAADKSVGIPKVRDLENNIHAGVKYLAMLRDRYFSAPDIAPAERVAFAWAAYNAGPAKIQRLRRQAEKRGLDPDRWFGSVDQLASRRIGREPVRYVSNINKYYVSYRLAYEARQETDAETEGLSRREPLSPPAASLPAG